MSADKSRPSNRGWRDGAKPTQRPTAKPGWKNETSRTTAATPRTPWSRRAKLALVGAGIFAVLAGIVIVILLFRPVKPPHLVLVGADYATNLKTPHNLAGKQGLDAVEDWARQRDARDKVTVQRVQLGASEGKPVDLAASLAPWRRWLDECKGSLTEKASEKVVLIVAMHGGADRDGPYLIPHDADPASRAGWVRLNDLLELFKELPDRTQKLLILDVTQVAASWPLGMLHNDFVRQMKAMDDKIARVPNLVILCASDEGQRSWTAGDGGATVFSHYLTEGVRGAAGDGSSHIHGDRLFAFVKDNVKKWVRDNRNEVQEPILLPASDGMERAKKLVVVVSDGSHKVAAPPDAAPTIGVELKQAWEEQQQLAARAPFVYTPHLWRNYLDALLRYEQLLRHGDRTSAGALRDEMDRLKRRIEESNSLVAEGGRLKLSSATRTLAMPASLGLSLSDKERGDLSRKFNELLENPDATVDDVRKLYQGKDAVSAALSRVHLAGVLLDQSIEDEKHILPEKDPRQAVRWAPLLDVRSGPRLAEGHFLVMLPRAWPTPHDAGLIKKALVVRKLAEESAMGLRHGDEAGATLPAYSEYLYRRIRESIEAGDRHRRLGEDRLFTAQPEVWEQSKRDLEQAAKSYTEAQTIALKLRQTLHARNKMLATMPYYSTWLALRPDSSELFDDSIKVWERIHKIDLLLEQPMPDVDLLTQETNDAMKAYQSVKSAFEQASRKYAEREVLPRRWHDTEALLAGPFIPAERRLELVENSRHIARQLNKEPGGSNMAEPGSPRESAVRQGRAAAAVLGRDYVDSAPGADRVKHETLLAWIEQPTREGKEWQESLTRAGEEVGHHWNRRSDRVRELTEKGMQNPQLSLEQAGRELQQGARLARHLDGAEVHDLRGLNPLEEDRRLRLYGLLHWQALRTFRDHWFGDNPKLPYFVESSRQLLADARALAGDGLGLSGEAKTSWLRNRLAPVQELEKQLTESGKMIVRYKGEDGEFHPEHPRLVLTDEKNITRTYQIEMEGSLPDGFEGVPVIQEMWDEWLRPIDPMRDSLREALDVVDAKKRIATRSYRLEPVANPVREPRKDESSHRLRGMFRGQEFGLRTAVDLHRMPDVIADQYPLRRGAVAVRADKSLLEQLRAQNTAISIVLDNSGSMLDNKRWEKALDALRQVLGDPEFPAGVTVNLRVFGEKGERGKSRPVLKDGVKWDSTKPKMLFERLKEFEPAPGTPTPLIDATMAAATDFPEKFPGVKIVIVITDGGDFFEETRDIPAKLMRAFPRTRNVQGREEGVQLYAIGFDQEFGTPKEKANSDQFRQTVKQLGGEHYDVKEVKELVARLKESMIPRLSFWVHHRNQTDPLQGGEITFAGPYLQWKDHKALTPGVYTLKMHLGGQLGRDLVFCDVRIDPGDSLVLGLRRNEQGDGFLFERDVQARTLNSTHKHSDRGWMAGVWQNYQTGSGSVQMMTTIEWERDQVLEAGKGLLTQVKPELVLYQLTAADRKLTPGLRFGQLPGYAAPAWSLDVSRWPQGARPTLDAWWSNLNVNVDNLHPFARPLASGVHYQLGVGKRNRFKTTIGAGQREDEIEIEGLSVETHKVRLQPDGAMVERPCLVVRIRHPEGRPYLVRLRKGADAERRTYAHGSHCFYTEAARYTALFPDWTAQELEQEIKHLELELISVEAFKKSSPHARLDLPPPTGNSSRPLELRPFRDFE